MTTTRSLRDEITNILDYLLSGGLIAYYNQVSMEGARVSWVKLHPDEPFLLDREEPTLRSYLHWARTGAYSALLPDGALLQVSYTVGDGDVVGHRLAYVPCPYKIDPDLVRSGDPLEEIIDLYSGNDPEKIILHSTVRFDYDPDNAAPGHPSSHMTLNTAECRIACSAPVGVGRFVDFVFRNFYGEVWLRNSKYFKSIVRNIGSRVIAEEDAGSLHMNWV